MLRDCDFQLDYRSDRENIASKFLEPALSNSRTYDRAVGYFTSGMLVCVIPGLQRFVVRHGHVRLIASPQMTDEDMAAISKGYANRKELAIRRVAEAVDSFLLAAAADARSLLSTLIGEGILDVKLAVAIGTGIYHEKIGIFGDGRDFIAFTGSLNETAAALALNFESIDVYRSWVEPDRVAAKRRDFEELWANRTPNVEILDFPDYLKNRITSAGRIPQSTNIAQPGVGLRAYQVRAVSAWVTADKRGFLSMATGSGKTRTALECCRIALQQGTRTVVILVPLKHLADQWAEAVLAELGIRAIICYGDNSWRDEVQLARVGQHVSRLPIVLIATYATAQSPQFVSLVHRLDEDRLLIADEAHNVTASMAQLVLNECYQQRLGLSATPDRYLDEIGTRRILDYFGGIIFEYSLGDAIAEGYLTRYRYEPILCVLTDAEQLEYDELVSMMSADARGRHSLLLLNKRESLLERAWDKMKKFEEAFAKDPEVGDEGHTLVYCQPELMDVVMGFVGHTLGIRAHRFTAKESVEARRGILERFVRGELKVLVAIRCLDEGVDIPSVRTAFVLNSTSNPKEFVQRRGRILRRAAGKDRAVIYDFVVLPQRSGAEDRDLLAKELKRFWEFASLAENRDEAHLRLASFARNIGLESKDVGEA